jgi:hypothetical protein
MSTIDHPTDLAGPQRRHGGHHDGPYYRRSGSLIADILNWATTVDHKKIGVMYLFAVLFMFFLGGVAALAVRLELLEPVRAMAAPRATRSSRASSSAPTRRTPRRATTSTTACSPCTARSWCSCSSCRRSRRAWATSSCRSCWAPRTWPSRGSTSLSWYIYVFGSIFGVSSSWAASTRAGRSTRRTQRRQTRTLGSGRPHDPRRVHPRVQLDPDRAELHRDGAQAPRPRHGLVRHAPVHLGDLRDQHHPGARDARSSASRCCCWSSSGSSTSASSTRAWAATPCSTSTSSGSTATRWST